MLHNSLNFTAFHLILPSLPRVSNWILSCLWLCIWSLQTLTAECLQKKHPFPVLDAITVCVLWVNFCHFSDFLSMKFTLHKFRCKKNRNIFIGICLSRNLLCICHTCTNQTMVQTSDCNHFSFAMKQFIKWPKRFPY